MNARGYNPRVVSIGDVTPVTSVPSTVPAGFFADTVELNLARAQGLLVGGAIGFVAGIAGTFAGLYFLRGGRR